MKKNIFIPFILFVLGACQSTPVPPPIDSSIQTALPSETALATKKLPTTIPETEIPYPYPYPTYATIPSRPEFPTTDPFATAPPQEPTATPEPLDVSGVWFVKPINAQQGWVLADGNLFLTDDAGQTWRQSPFVKAGSEFIQHAFFLSPQQAWVLICDAQSSGDEIKISYTSDGGEAWRKTDITLMKDITMFPGDTRRRCGSFNLGRIFFLNAQHGWVLLDTTESMNSHQGEMFQTIDGGQSWQHLDTSPRGDFFFVTDTVGWMLATCCTGGPMLLYHTEDNGKNWQRISVNGADQYDNFFLPIFLDQQVGMMAVTLEDEKGISDGPTFFKTQDGGVSWHQVGKLSLLPSLDELTIRARDIQIWDERTWVVNVPNHGVYWTMDGGQTWAENTYDKTHSVDSIVALDSAISGWGLNCDQGGWPYCVYLLRTEDMGAHWETVEVKP